MAPNAALRPFQIAALCSAEAARPRRPSGSKLLAISTMSREQAGDLLLGAFDLDDQQRLDVERIAGLGEGLADLDRRLVHVLDGDGNDARGDDGGDAAARPPRSNRSRASSDARPRPRAGCARVASVTMPNWPSEPTMRARRS